MKMKRKMNKKGFTLIELLAVIIILAILMTLAITAMSGYIRGARRDTFVTTALQYSNAVRLSFVNGDYSSDVMPSYGECLAISTETVALESGSHESPFNSDYDSSYSFVIVYNNATSGADTYQYYIQMVDEANNGFSVIEENGLDGDLVSEQNATSDYTIQSISSMSAGSTITLYEATSTTTIQSAGSCTLSGVVQ